MEFYSQNEKKRPKRLTEKTRRFARDSLDGKYGREALKTPFVTLDGILGFESLTPTERYDLAVQKIAEEAPIRVCDGERISGAATLGLATKHYVPATYGGNSISLSVSHLTVDFERVLKEGINGLQRRAQEAYGRYKGTEKEAFSKSCLNCIEAFSVWHGRYLKALEGKEEYAANYDNLKRVPFSPATNFYEAVQSLWFTFAFIRLCGNWPGIGRLDELLGGYLKADLNEGRLTLNEAREILAHFFIKGCEWINGDVVAGGDAQHYQNVVLCGVNEFGEEVTNEVTYLVLDVLEELGIGDFPTSIRVNANTDERLLRRVTEVMQYGGGILAVYNEEVVLKALENAGYAKREARRFANDGCWEVQIPGKTFFIYAPFDSLQLLQKKTLRSYAEPLDFPNFEALYGQYLVDLRAAVGEIVQGEMAKFEGRDPITGAWKWKPQGVCTVVSLFEEGCVEKGACYWEGGPIYNVFSPHIGGLADTVNALYALKKLVYDEKKVSLSRFLEILRADWEGEEILRQYVLNRYDYYGNDRDEVDGIAVRLLSDFADACVSHDGKCGYRFPAGVSTFGRQLGWASDRLASPHGRRKGEILAANCSPTPNTDKEGATAMIRSYCKADHTKIATGAALDVKLLPSSVAGKDGVQALVSLIRGFVSLGGFFMQPDVVDAALLRAAQERPEDYQNLSVRVSGWNARFVTLDRAWQQMVIEQNER